MILYIMERLDSDLESFDLIQFRYHTTQYNSLIHVEIHLLL